MEVWIRLCLQKYVKNSYAGPGIGMRAAMEMMFKEFCFPVFKRFDAHEWRKTKLWVEEVDYVLKVAMPALREIYKKHTGRFSMPGAPKYMSVCEFEDMVVNANCLNEKFGSK